MSPVERWATAAGLTNDTIRILMETGFDSIRSAKLIRDDDIVLMQLTLGQARLLEQAVQELQRTEASNTAAPISSAASSHQVTHFGNLSDLLAGCESGPTNMSASAHPPSAVAPDQDPRLYLRSEVQGEGLRICDFIPMQSRDEVVEEEIVHGDGGTTIIVRKQGKRRTSQDITPAHWITANARIMHELMNSGKLKGEAISDYLGYTAKIGQYATLYTWQSVMDYDKAYRQSQASLCFRWGSDSQHLANLYLKRRQETSAPKVDVTRPRYTPSQKVNQTAGPFTQDGQEICRLFNDGECRSARCKRAHVCRLPACGRDHPIYQHPKNAIPSKHY
jgi:hypothetical protein